MQKDLFKKIKNDFKQAQVISRYFKDNTYYTSDEIKAQVKKFLKSIGIDSKRAEEIFSLNFYSDLTEIDKKNLENIIIMLKNNYETKTENSSSSQLDISQKNIIPSPEEFANKFLEYDKKIENLLKERIKLEKDYKQLYEEYEKSTGEKLKDLYNMKLKLEAATKECLLKKNTIEDLKSQLRRSESVFKKILEEKNNEISKLSVKIANLKSEIKAWKYNGSYPIKGILNNILFGVGGLILGLLAYGIGSHIFSSSKDQKIKQPVQQQINENSKTFEQPNKTSSNKKNAPVYHTVNNSKKNTHSYTSSTTMQPKQEPIIEQQNKSDYKKLTNDILSKWAEGNIYYNQKKFSEALKIYDNLISNKNINSFYETLGGANKLAFRRDLCKLALGASADTSYLMSCSACYSNYWEYEIVIDKLIQKGNFDDAKKLAIQGNLSEKIWDIENQEIIQKKHIQGASSRQEYLDTLMNILNNCRNGQKETVKNTYNWTKVEINEEEFMKKDYDNSKITNLMIEIESCL